MGKQDSENRDENVLEEGSNDQKIRVQEGNGFLFQLMLNQRVGFEPEEIYSVLKDPQSESIFRSIQKCTYRRVLEDDNNGKRKLEVGHRAISRFLFISVAFDTHLHVWEDDRERRISFQNAREGFMKKFDGSWCIQPYSDDAYQRKMDDFDNNTHTVFQQHNPLKWLANASNLFAPSPSSSLVTLEQSLLPSVPAPPGVKHLIRGLCAKQLKNLMEDVVEELHRRRNEKERGGESSGGQVGASGGSKATAAASMTLSRPTFPDLWKDRSPLFVINLQV